MRRQIVAFDQLHDEGARPRGRRCGDIGVIQRGEDLRLAGEARQAVGVGGEEVGQDLDGDIAIEARVGAR